MSSQCPGKNEWPELKGYNGYAAAEIIEKENPNVEAIVLLDGTPTTKDFRCNRVWVWVNSYDIVIRTPKVVQSDEPSDQINHFILTLAWRTNFCRTTRCTGSNLPSYFTVHGLWPHRAFQQGDRSPWSTTLINCEPSSKLNLTAIASRLPSLRRYWPSLTNMDPKSYYFFWQHEWKKHGTCTEPMFTQSYYFGRAMELVTSLDIRRMLQDAGIKPGDLHLTASDVRAAFSGKDDIKEPYIHCDRSRSFLVELYFCLSRDTRTFIDCKSIYGKDNDCGTSFGFV